MHYQHNNLLDVSAFEMPIKSVKDPVILLKDNNGIEKQTKMDKQVVVYRPDTMEILGRSRSNQYKIVNPVELFSNHAKRLVEQKNLPQSNITVDDYVFEGGRKQKRTVTFHDLSKDMGDGSVVNMRSDIFNSVDMSWLYQAFAGAYRNLCQNGLVFGGQRMYHVRKKHTSGLNINATLNQIGGTFQMFSENQELMQKMMERKISLKGMAHILANNICKTKATSKQLLDDTSISVNYKLLDYFIDQIQRESGSLGYTVWNLFNALTYWSSHIDDTFERVNKDTGKITEVKMSREGSKTHTAQVKREDKIREFMNSDDWQALMNNTYVFTHLHPSIQERI